MINNSFRISIHLNVKIIKWKHEFTRIQNNKLLIFNFNLLESKNNIMLWKHESIQIQNDKYRI